MYRSSRLARRRALEWLGIGAAVLVLGWPAGSAPFAPSAPRPAAAPMSLAAAGRPAAVGPPTLTVYPASATASDPMTALAFTYTANLVQDGTLTITVPPGWTPPSSTPGAGYTTVSCPQQILSAPPCGLTVDPAAMTITVTNVYRDSDWGRTLTVDYTMATPPATAGTSTFNATEQDSATPTPVLLPALPVAVNCPDGTGRIAVAPPQVTASQLRTLMFSYTAGDCGTQAGGLLELQVPSGWPADGNVAWTGGGAASISGSTITAPAGNLAPGQTVTLAYGPVQVPAILQPYAFTAEEQSSQGGTLEPLSGPLTVTVTQAFVSPPGGAGMIAVSPRQAVAGRARTLTFTYTAPDGGLAASGEVTVQVPGEWTAPSGTPGRAGYVSSSEGAISASGRLITVTGVALAAGQQLTITYAAGIAPRLPGPSTFVTSERPDGTVRLAALAQPASVTVTAAGGGIRPRPTSSPVLLYLLIGLAVVAAVGAGALAAHLLRRGGQVTAAASVRAVPHTGPPPTLAVRNTGRRPTLTVRIEPHASTSVTTIREDRP